MRPFRSPSGFLIALTLVCAACGGSGPSSPASHGPKGTSQTPSAAFPVTIADDDGVSVTLDAAPQRIITFAPSATEIAYALGLGDKLVGVSGRYDDYPAAAKQVQEVGGAGDFGVDPNIETVVSLEPDLLITIEGGDAWKSRLRELGVPVFTIDATDLEDLIHDIGTVGRLTGATPAADRLAARMAAEDQRIEEAIAGEARVSCFLEVYYPPLTTTGPGTFISDLLDRAGCDSTSASATSDYPEWSVDDLVRESPDVYLVSSESGVSPEAVGKRPGFDAIDAVASGNIALIDSDLVSRAGPRVMEGLLLLAEALHPNAF